jgi:hypothetical protein
MKLSYGENPEHQIPPEYALVHGFRIFLPLIRKKTDMRCG